MTRIRYGEWPLTELSMAELSEALDGCIILEEETICAIKKDGKSKLSARARYTYSEDDILYITESIKSGRTVADIAKQYNYDPGSISRLFRKSTGQTVKEYKRMNKQKTA